MKQWMSLSDALGWWNTSELWNSVAICTNDYRGGAADRFMQDGQCWICGKLTEEELEAIFVMGCSVVNYEKRCGGKDGPVIARLFLELLTRPKSTYKDIEVDGQSRIHVTGETSLAELEARLVLRHHENEVSGSPEQPVLVEHPAAHQHLSNLLIAMGVLYSQYWSLHACTGSSAETAPKLGLEQDQVTLTIGGRVLAQTRVEHYAGGNTKIKLYFDNTDHRLGQLLHSLL